MTPPSHPVWIALGRAPGPGGWQAAHMHSDGTVAATVTLDEAHLTVWVREQEAAHSPRWVWPDTASLYGRLLAGGTRVRRCHDLRLGHAIVRDRADLSAETAASAVDAWNAGPGTGSPQEEGDTLFALEPEATASALPDDLDAILKEWAWQRVAIASSSAEGRLRMLIAAESAGALAAAEMHAAGLPWDLRAHDRILADVLGARPAPGALPAKMQRLADDVRHALGDPGASLDSPPKLLRSLHRVGVDVESTSRWELERHTHPVIRPLIEYKRMSRLFAANGWAWGDEWVEGGRFRPVYVPAGVVTGRWASSGGGALQIPRALRAAVRADDGWTLVIADVAQLEPRVLAAMAGDLRLAEAARGRDLYEGVVATGAVGSRADAKMALLGAMYGATSGESGRLVPRLRRSFPRAMKLVDDAARVGEQGGIVSTNWGRSCPPPGAGWRRVQERASQPDASSADQDRARRAARDRGRFTRNFVVQGTAAEWALAWIADVRQRLHLMETEGSRAVASGPVFSGHPHLAFFLHDEIIVHTPADRAEEVADAVRQAADSATRLLFGDFPLDFPLELRIAQTAAKA